MVERPTGRTTLGCGAWSARLCLGPMTAGWAGFHLSHPANLDQAQASIPEPEVRAGSNLFLWVNRLRWVLHREVGHSPTSPLTAASS